MYKSLSSFVFCGSNVFGTLFIEMVGQQDIELL